MTQSDSGSVEDRARHALAQAVGQLLDSSRFPADALAAGGAPSGSGLDKQLTDLVQAASAAPLPATQATATHGTIGGEPGRSRTLANTTVTAPDHAKHDAAGSAHHAAAPTATPAGTIRIKIRHGDTLSGLAHQHGTTVAHLQQINNLGSSTHIYSDNYLLVPASHTPAASTAAGHHAPHAPAASTAVHHAPHVPAGQHAPHTPAGPTAAGQHAPHAPAASTAAGQHAPHAPAGQHAPHTPAASTAAGQHAPHAPAASKPDSEAAARAVAFAVEQLGKPYKFGAKGPDAYDCSGLVHAAWQAAGVSIPSGTDGQVTAGTAVAEVSQLEPGDLVFIPGDEGTRAHPHHVGMYIGSKHIIEAPHTGDVVKIIDLSRWSAQISAMRRVAE